MLCVDRTGGHSDAEQASNDHIHRHPGSGYTPLYQQTLSSGRGDNEISDITLQQPPYSPAQAVLLVWTGVVVTKT